MTDDEKQEIQRIDIFLARLAAEKECLENQLQALSNTQTEIDLLKQKLTDVIMEYAGLQDLNNQIRERYIKNENDK